MADKIKWLSNKLVALVTKYGFAIHAVLLGWNAFVTSWATGLPIPIPLSEFGLPDLHIDARGIVVWLQSHAHISTKSIGFVTLLVNGTIMYVNWAKKHNKEVPVELDNVPGAIVPKTGSTAIVSKDNTVTAIVPAAQADDALAKLNAQDKEKT